MQRKLDTVTWVFIIVGGVFILFGIILGLIMPQGLTRNAERIEQLTPISASELERQAPGTEILLEGRVSSTNPILSQTFVAYISEMYHGTDENDYAQWQEQQRVTPPLQLDIDTTRVQILNQSYVLTGNLKNWQESDVLSYSSIRNTGTMRERGLEQGAEAMVIGKAQSTAEGNGIEAEILYAGNRAGYIADHRDVAFWMRWAGLAVGFAGVLILGVVLFQQRKAKPR